MAGLSYGGGRGVPGCSALRLPTIASGLGVPAMTVAPPTAAAIATGTRGAAGPVHQPTDNEEELDRCVYEGGTVRAALDVRGRP